MSDVLTPTKRAFVIASIMLATFMVAIEATIVATAMPRIVGELGGFTYYSWVFSAFLLAQSTTTVIYGKLADTFGRKPMLVGGIALFLVGSLLCGFAWSMSSLIAFRLLQGLGAGAIQPVTMTIIGDLYKMEERGRVQGLMSSVWAASAVIGPLAGGIIIDHLSWAWIFWLNLPVGAFTILGLLFFLKESVRKREARIDYLGALLFSISTIALLTILTEIDAGPWLLGVLSLVFLGAGWLFLVQERRAPEPIISIALWSRRLVATSNAATLFSGMAMIGLTTVLPIYVQGVLGRSAIVAGFTLTMLVVGWPFAVMLSPRFYRLFGVRRTLRFGSVILPVGALLLPLLTPESSPMLAGVSSFLMGFGMGLLSITTIALVQDSVEWSARGSATASIIFARSIGSTIGATVLGTVLNLGVAHFGSGALAAKVHDILNQPTGLVTLAGNPAVRSVFDQALHWSFWGVVVVSALAFISSWLVPIKHRAKPAGPGIADIEIPEVASH
jgi:EmrB/QacA subfamily drug resistance transporter